MNYHRCTVYTTFFFMFSFFIFVFSRFYFSSFWTSCGLRCRPFSPPGTCLQFLSRIGFSVPTARRLSSNVANSRPRAFRESIFYARKRTYEYVHSVRIELAKLILVGTRITYQATGDAVFAYCCNCCIYHRLQLYVPVCHEKCTTVYRNIMNDFIKYQVRCINL